jgi:hypothetical protein
MKIAKIIGLIVLILIPLSITTFVGFYSYDRYQNTWLPNYIQKGLDTVDKIERVVRFDSISYTLDPVYEYTDPNHMFKLVVYGRLMQSPSVTQYVDYVMYMYAIDFNELPEVIKPKITLLYGVGESSTLTFNYETRFEDKEATPETSAAANNKYMSFKITFAATVDMAGSVDFTIFTGSDLSEDYRLLHEDDITGIIHHPMTFNNSTLTVSGYNQNIETAGYLPYVLGKYIWWQALISLVLSGALSYLFYLVWQVDTVTPATRKYSNKK